MMELMNFIIIYILSPSRLDRARTSENAHGVKTQEVVYSSIAVAKVKIHNCLTYDFQPTRNGIYVLLLVALYISVSLQAVFFSFFL